MKLWQEQSVESLITVGAIIVFRMATYKFIDKSALKSEELKRRWQVQIRNLSFFIFIFCMFMIWGTQLRSIAFSLMAIVAAIVLATKELILCLTGSVLKASAGSFTVGDRIQINTIRGIVTDQTLLATTILEVGPQLDSHQITGKTITIPNSLFLSQPVINEQAGDYVLHSFQLKIKIDENLDELKNRLLAVLNENSYKGNIKKVMTYLDKNLVGKNIDEDTCKPRIVTQVHEAEGMKLIFRAPVDRRNIGRMEQSVFDAYAQFLSDKKKEKAEEEKEKE